MELKDFVVTPVVLVIVYLLAYLIRPRVTDLNTRRYFIPALTVKIIGAIAVGLIYQFYYDGGDTFNYHTHGSRVIWNAFMDNHLIGFKLLLNADITEGVYSYANKIWYYNDPKSFLVVQITTLFDLITLSTYSATAVFFAIFSFSGMWALYTTFYKKYQRIHLALAIAILFIPSVFFWGSGIFKDTITLGGLGWLTFTIDKLIFEKRYKLVYILIGLLSAWIIFSIKIYILIVFIPAVFLWVYFAKIGQVKSVVLRVLIAPILLCIFIVTAYTVVEVLSYNDPRYQLDKLAATSAMTAYDIRFGWGARHGEGSGYYLGELDGTFLGMIKYIPSAINVSLFRPYFWEIQNPLMLLSALESFGFLIITLFIFIKVGPFKVFQLLVKPDILFCLAFALMFGFAVGISTFNFGTLSRYKIPVIPYYLTGLIILYHKRIHVNKDKNTPEFDLTE